MAKAKTRLTARAKATAACGGLKPHSVSPEALAQAFWDMVKPDGEWWGIVLAAHDLPVPEGW